MIALKNGEYVEITAPAPLIEIMRVAKFRVGKFKNGVGLSINKVIFDEANKQ